MNYPFAEMGEEFLLLLLKSKIEGKIVISEKISKKLKIKKVILNSPTICEIEQGVHFEVLYFYSVVNRLAIS